MKVTTRLMGAEIEYLGSSNDSNFEYVDEYYRNMREVNSILLPGSDILSSLMVLKDIIEKIDTKISNKLGTYGWVNSYGIAYNGVHLHLSGNIDIEALERNVFRLIDKYGLSPRTVTSWHIFNRPTRYNFKNKGKHVPIYKTPRQTVEIRILDIEYFINDEILKDLAEAISYAYSGRDTVGNYKWVSELLTIPIENYKDCCSFLDKNMAKWWTKQSDGHYTNDNGGYNIRFKDLEGWHQEPEREQEEPPEFRSIRSGRASPTLVNTSTVVREGYTIHDPEYYRNSSTTMRDFIGSLSIDSDVESQNEEGENNA